MVVNASVDALVLCFSLHACCISLCVCVVCLQIGEHSPNARANNGMVESCLMLVWTAGDICDTHIQTPPFGRPPTALDYAARCR